MESGDMREPCLVVVVQDKLRAKMGNTVQPPAANAGDGPVNGDKGDGDDGDDGDATVIARGAS